MGDELDGGFHPSQRRWGVILEPPGWLEAGLLAPAALVGVAILCTPFVIETPTVLTVFIQKHEHGEYGRPPGAP